MMDTFYSRVQTATSPFGSSKKLANSPNETVIVAPVGKQDEPVVRGGVKNQPAISAIHAGITAQNTRTLSGYGSIESSVSALVSSAIIMALEESAERGDYRLFSGQAEAIQWRRRQPNELVKAIDLALSLGLTSLAMKLAQQGKEMFPFHEHIQRAANTLAPSVVRTVQTPPVSGLDASRAWLNKNSSAYHGQWVAVREGELVGSAKSLKELNAIVGQSTNNTLIIKVL